MVFRRIDKKLLGQIDWQLIILMLLVCAVGLGVVYSAGFDPKTGDSFKMGKDLQFMGGGLIAFVVCMTLATGFWKRIAIPFYIVGAGLLALILVKGVVANGARRWLELGGFRMQPSEFMKLAVILVLARIFSRESAPRDGYSFRTLVLPVAVLLVPVVLILKEPDLGTALCFLLIGGSMILIAGVKRSTIIAVLVVGLVLALPAWEFLLQDYQRQRVLTFLSPEVDPLGTGYHAIQSKIAVGSGAVFGKGFLKGTQTQLRFLPEQTTDFIFSVLAEEWGFLGSTIVIVLYSLLILHLLNIASRCAESFPAFVTFGVAAMFFWHVLINIGMVIGVLPVVGVTLAMLSYGGSSIVTMMASLGVVAGFSIRRFMFS